MLISWQSHSQLMVESRLKPQLVWVETEARFHHPAVLLPLANIWWAWAGPTHSSYTSNLECVCLCFCPGSWLLLRDWSPSLTPSLLCWGPHILPGPSPTSSPGGLHLFPPAARWSLVLSWPGSPRTMNPPPVWLHAWPLPGGGVAMCHQLLFQWLKCIYISPCWDCYI